MRHTWRDQDACRPVQPELVLDELVRTQIDQREKDLAVGDVAKVSLLEVVMHPAERARLGGRHKGLAEVERLLGRAPQLAERAAWIGLGHEGATLDTGDRGHHSNTETLGTGRM